MKKISVNPVFLIVVFWICFAMGFYSAIAYFFAVLLHELGHYFAARTSGYQLSKFSFSPYGVSLSYYGQTLDYGDEIKIAFAGPFVNLIVSVCAVAFWWIFPATYIYTHEFLLINISMAAINLLPAYPLDGGRIFVLFFSRFASREIAIKITVAINIILSAVFFVLFFVFLFFNFNPSFLLFAVFLILGVADMKFSSLYQKVNIFTKRVKNFSKPKIFVITPDAKIKDIINKIDSNKTCLFVVVFKNGKKIILSDYAVLKLSLSCDISKSIFEVLEI